MPSCPTEVLSFSFDDRAGFLLRYPCGDGGEEVFTYGLRSVRGMQEGEQYRCLVFVNYEHRFPDGARSPSVQTIRVPASSSHRPRPVGETQEEYIPCVHTEFLEYLNADEFPRTLEAVHAYAASAPKFDAGRGRRGRLG